VITFQEDAARDVFNPIRDRLKMDNSKLRQRGADYLCYTMLDLIVDNYFFVMEKLSDRIEDVEEEVTQNSKTLSLSRINSLRKELIVLKRNIAPGARPDRRHHPQRKRPAGRTHHQIF
jgi:magnesium transporter